MVAGTINYVIGLYDKDLASEFCAKIIESKVFTNTIISGGRTVEILMATAWIPFTAGR